MSEMQDGKCGSVYRGRGGLEMCTLGVGHDDNHLGRRTVWTDEDQMSSVGLTRAELRSEIDELIRNAYHTAWREARRRPDAAAPDLEIDWTQPGGVRITEIWDGDPKP